MFKRELYLSIYEANYHIKVVDMTEPLTPKWLEIISRINTI